MQTYCLWNLLILFVIDNCCIINESCLLSQLWRKQILIVASFLKRTKCFSMIPITDNSPCYSAYSTSGIKAVGVLGGFLLLKVWYNHTKKQNEHKYLLSKSAPTKGDKPKRRRKIFKNQLSTLCGLLETDEGHWCLMTDSLCMWVGLVGHERLRDEEGWGLHRGECAFGWCDWHCVWERHRKERRGGVRWDQGRRERVREGGREKMSDRVKVYAAVYFIQVTYLHIYFFPARAVYDWQPAAL